VSDLTASREALWAGARLLTLPGLYPCGVFRFSFTTSMMVGHRPVSRGSYAIEANSLTCVY